MKTYRKRTIKTDDVRTPKQIREDILDRFGVDVNHRFERDKLLFEENKLSLLYGKDNES